ncbi:hypothetical protein MNBD_GAMMA22-2419 [hydrothermal vent metagenome]|uniref:B box-type domain-containing protein n=1 Tax=hydrothermal vent metagenome TaxID=652676 RepID=A0A3B0ZMC2_9ZZZZ
MAQIVCKYHNERPAKWFCEPCQINFCSSCIPRRAIYADVKCPVCHNDVQALAAENSIESFWNRLPFFFLYPIKFSSLLFLFLLSLMSIGIEYDPILAISIPIFVIIFFLRYAYISLEQTAKGHMQIPGFSIDLLFNQLDIPLKQILIIVAAIALNFTVYDIIGKGAFIFTLILSIIAAPASIMVLATEYSFFRAFNPLIIARLIMRVGKSYAILCLFLALLMLSSEVSFALMSKVIPVKYIWPEYFFINMYFTLIMYTMMGYVIFQFHEQLGYKIEIDLDQHTKDDNQESDQNKHESIIQAEILLKEGKIELAIDVLSKAIKSFPADFSLKAMYQKLLKVTGNTDALEQHASSYIERSLMSHKQALAVDVFIETREIIPNFLPNKAKSRYELAQYLNEKNYTEYALACVNNLHRDFPSYDGITKAYFLAAKIMCEKLGDDDKAITVLEFVLSNYTINVLKQEMLDYLEMIKNLDKDSLE